MGGTVSVSGEVKGRGNEFFKAGKFEDAVEAYTLALDADAKDHTVYSNRSAARMKLQQHGFAITDALSCVALAPTWPKGYFRLGMALAAVNKHGEAADNLRKALALCPDDATIIAELDRVEQACAKSGGNAGRGYLYTWGASEAVGRGDVSGAGGRSAGGSTSTPKMLEGAMGRQVIDVACGLQHTVIVTSEGHVLAWGSNKYGQCGTWGQAELIRRPQFVSGLFGHRCTSVACGGGHTLAVTDAGKIFSWGQGACGQLGLGIKTPVVGTPTAVTALQQDLVRGIACGFGHSVIVLTNGDCLTCGWNNAGQCGQGSTDDVMTPVRVAGLKGRGSVQHAAAGGGHTALVMHSGLLITFGSGSCGQLGHGIAEDSLHPKQVDGVLKNVQVSAVACGEEFTVCICAHRRVFAWGLNNVGQLGGASDEQLALQPVELAALRDRNVELLCCNQCHTLALTSEGRVLEWGREACDVGGLGCAGMTAQQVQAALRGENPMGGDRIGGTCGAGKGVGPKELSGFTNKSVQRIECGRRHFCVLTRGTHAASCVATGEGLASAVAGRKQKLTIVAKAEDGMRMNQGGDRFQGLLFAEDGDVMADVCIDDCMDGTYECSYTSAKAGVCSLWLRLGGAHICGSPFQVKVEAQEASAAHSSLDLVCSLQHRLHEAGQPLNMWVYVRDRFGNACSVSVGELQITLTSEAAADDVAVALDYVVEMHADGKTPIVRCTPTAAGHVTAQVAVKSKGVIGGEGESITIMSAAADAKKSSAFGPGLQAACAGDYNEFYVALFDRFGNPAEMLRHGYNQEFMDLSDVPLDISLHQMLPGGGRGPAVKISAVSCGFFYGTAHRKSTFSIGYTVFSTAPLALQLTLGGKTMFGAPLSIPVRAAVTSALYSQVSGDGLEGGSLRSGQLTKTLKIVARDEYENLRSIGGDKFEVTVRTDKGCQTAEVQDCGNGSYTCVYIVTKPGVHSLDVRLLTGGDGTREHVSCSPYSIRISPDPAEEVRRRHEEQEVMLRRQKEAAEKRKMAEAKRREAAAAAERERERTKAATAEREAAERKKREDGEADRKAAEARAKEMEKRRRVMERLKREEQARRRAVEQEEQKRQAVLEKMKVADEKRMRPGTATKRAGGGFVLSFDGAVSTARSVGQPKAAWE